MANEVVDDELVAALRLTRFTSDALTRMTILYWDLKYIRDSRDLCVYMLILSFVFHCEVLFITLCFEAVFYSPRAETTSRTKTVSPQPR